MAGLVASGATTHLDQWAADHAMPLAGGFSSPPTTLESIVPLLDAPFHPIGVGVAQIVTLPGQVVFSLLLVGAAAWRLWTRGRVDGQVVYSQVAITTTRGRVEAVWLEPAAPEAVPEAVDAVRAADLILLGPGSTYTSVVPNLLVPEVGRALAEAADRVVYICNLEPQPAETIGFPPEAHVAALLDHCPGLRVPRVVCQRPDDPARAEREAAAFAALGSQVIHADVAADGTQARHDPERLAAALKGLA